MRIASNFAKLLVLKTIHSSEKEFHRLTQENRRICEKAIDCFLTQKEASVSLPEGAQLEDRLILIEDSLFTKPKNDRNWLKKTWPIKKITSLFLGFLNLIHWRISSSHLTEKMKRAEEKFFKESWLEYVEEYSTVDGGCPLDSVDLFFLGDDHTDFFQEKFRHNFIDHYASHTDENIVLLEGNDTFPTEFKGKKFVVKTWENEDDIPKTNELYEKIATNFKRMKDALDQLAALRQKKSTDRDLFERLVTENGEALQEDARLKAQERDSFEARTNNLLKNTRENSKANRKVFVSSGTNHLNGILKQNFDVAAALVVPKISRFGEKNSALQVKKMASIGSYSASYRDL